MRILFAAPVTFDRITIFISHYVTGLSRAARRLGHESRIVQTPELDHNPRRGKFLDSEYETLRRYWRGAADFPQELELMLKLHREVSEFKPDILFLHLIDTTSVHMILDSIRKSGTLVLMWLGVHPSQVSSGIHRLAARSDCTLIYDPRYVEYYENALGIYNTRLLPLGCDIEYYDSVTPDDKFKKDYGADICFSGMVDPKREEYLRALSGMNPGIWTWDRENLSDDLKQFYRGEAYGDKLIKILKSSKIALNVHREFEISGGNYRLFEIPASGVLQVADEKCDIGKYFEPDREIVTFTGPEDLVRKVKYYLKHEGEREEIALAGYGRVKKDHALIHRMKKIVEIAESL